MGYACVLKGYTPGRVGESPGGGAGGRRSVRLRSPECALGLGGGGGLPTSHGLVIGKGGGGSETTSETSERCELLLSSSISAVAAGSLFAIPFKPSSGPACAPIIWLSCFSTSIIVSSELGGRSTKTGCVDDSDGGESIWIGSDDGCVSGVGFTSFIRFNISSTFGAAFLEAFCSSSNLSALKSSTTTKSSKSQSKSSNSARYCAISSGGMSALQISGSS